MSESMVRKQVYLRREHDRKLKALASVRGCTEAEVIREAIDRLPDPEGDFVARLEAAGLLVPKRDSPDLPRGAELEKLNSMRGLPHARNRSGCLRRCSPSGARAGDIHLSRHLGIAAAL
jgi:hypothetical protein